MKQLIYLFTFLAIFIGVKSYGQCEILGLDPIYTACDSSDVTLTTALGAGQWTGPVTGTSSAAIFNPATAGAGSHNISYYGYDLNVTGFESHGAFGATAISLADDAVSASIPMGFTFNFFGNDYTQLVISSNGNVQFTSASNGLLPYIIPTAGGAIDNYIAFYQTDLDPGNGSGGSGDNQLQYTTTGASPNRIFRLNFWRVDQYVDGNNISAVLYLFEGSNNIVMGVQGPSDGSAVTQGIENIGGTVGYALPSRNSMAFSSPTSTFQTYAPCTFDSTAVVLPDTFVVAFCQDTTFQISGASNTIAASDLDNGSMDGCSGLTFTASQTTFTNADVGANNITLYATNTNGDVDSCISVVTIIPSAYTWTGVTSTDWSDPTNWDVGVVPGFAGDVLIPDVSGASGNFPTTTVDIGVTNLTVDANASLNIAPTLGLGLISPGVIINNGTLTLKSDATGTGYYDDFSSPGGTYLGNMTVERYVPAGSGLGQRLIGSPVSGGSISGLDATYSSYPTGQLTSDVCGLLLFSSPYSNILEWHEDGPYTIGCVEEGWWAISEAASLTPGRGYSAWMSDGSVLSVTGPPNSGDLSYATTGVTGTGPAAADGWHVLANPYPSSLDVSSVILSGFTSPQTYDGSSGPFSGTYNPILVGGNNLAIMQGFAAQATAGSTFNALQADRNTASSTWQSQGDLFTQMLELTVVGNNFADRTYLYFSDNNTIDSDFNANGDCRKRESNVGQPTLFTIMGNDHLSLNGLSLEDFGQSVDLGLLPGSDASFTMNFEGLENFPDQTTIYLEDKLTGNIHDVSQGSYNFAATTVQDVNRFVLHFVPVIDFNIENVGCLGELGSIESINTNSNRMFELTNNGSLVANGSISTLNTTLDEGLYNLVVTDQFGGLQSYAIEIESLPQVQADIYATHIEVELLEVVEFANVSIGATHFEWYLNDELILSDVNMFGNSFDEIGIQEIKLVATNNYCQDEKIVYVNVVEKTTTSIADNDEEISNAFIFTHSSELIVDLTKTNLKGTTSIEVYNLLGQVVGRTRLNDATLGRIDLSHVTPGYYIVKLSNGNTSITKKVNIF